MPEAPKPPKPEKPQVLSLVLGEGGVQLGTAAFTFLPPPTRAQFEGPRSALQDFAMELDRALGGVVLRFKDKEGQAHMVLVPLSHVKQLELSE